MNKPSRVYNSAKNSSWSIAEKIIYAITSAVPVVIFIKLLGVQYAGVSGLFIDILFILSIAECGIGAAITFAMYKPLADGDFIKITALSDFLKKAYRIVTLVIIGVGLCFLPFLKFIIKDVPDVREEIWILFMLSVLGSAASYVCSYRTVLLSASQNQHIISKVSIVISFVRVTAECLVLLIFRNLYVYLIVKIITTVVQNIIIKFAAEKKYPELKKYRDVKTEPEEAKKLGLNIRALVLQKIGYVALTGTDSIIISSVLGTAVVGLVSVYKGICLGASELLRQIFVGVEPSIGDMATTHDPEGQHKVFRAFWFGIFAVVCVGCTVIYTVIDPVVVLIFGKSYMLTRAIKAALIFDFFVVNMLRTVSAFRKGNGIFVEGQIRSIILAVLNIALSALLVHKYGAFGVLIATPISRLLAEGWYDPMIVYKKVFKKKVWVYYLKYLLYFAVTAVSCAATELISGVSVWLAVALSPFIPAALIFIIFFWTKDYGYFRYYLTRLSGKNKERIKFKKEAVNENS